MHMLARRRKQNKMAHHEAALPENPEYKSTRHEDAQHEDAQHEDTHSREGQATSQEPQKMIDVRGLVKIFQSEGVEVTALKGVHLEVLRGDHLAIIGASGSGKSTLLNIIGGLDRPSAGTVQVAGVDLLKLSPRELNDFRLRKVGFVWQNGGRNLLPYLTALDHVLLMMRLAGRVDRPYAMELIERVGLSHRMYAYPAQLSGGEQQRVAIALSLANRPELLLADEPTGALDPETSAQVLALLREIHRTLGMTIVIVTHDLGVARTVDRVVMMRDGLVSTEYIRAIDETPSADAAHGEGTHEGRGAYKDAPTHGVEQETLYEIAEGSGPGVAPGALHLAAHGAGRADRGEERTRQQGLLKSAEHRAYAVVDEAGRLQLPEEYAEALGIDTRVVVEMEEGRIVIRPPQKETATRKPDGPYESKKD
ncbi:MAG: ABC-transporter ATP-binding protein [Candidatus Carbobacillus altaicus]|uniref:ABC-transporter ATP-binding protein n=1 Tax=Candidatus Carbonibacillus altaicus TaxID=2163959 RepID=A0A2R6Y4I6_9BACL|nr:MAG: ABC-transporter ATP-binding protein [Candidatus Carbobacillus altaicus]